MLSDLALAMVPGLGAFTSVAGATAAIKSLVSYGGEIRDTSENIGVSVEFLQRFRTAASLAGVGTETATKALAVFNQTLGSAIDGEEKAELKFAKLGISLRDSSGQARSTEAVMLDVADAIKNAGSDAQRSAIAFELFGKKGLKMVGALKGGAEEMANQMAKVSIVSEAQIESLDKLGDKATEVFRAWKAGMAGGFADVFSGPAVKGLEALSVFNDKASTMIGAIGAALMTSWEEGQSPLEIYNELLAEAQNRVEVLGSEMRRNLAQKDAILSEKTLQKLNEARDILMDIQMESAAPNVRAADFSKQIEVRFNKAGLLEFEAAQAEAEGKLELDAQKNIEAAKERTEIEKLNLSLLKAQFEQVENQAAVVSTRLQAASIASTGESEAAGLSASIARAKAQGLAYGDARRAALEKQASDADAVVAAHEVFREVLKQREAESQVEAIAKKIELSKNNAAEKAKLELELAKKQNELATASLSVQEKKNRLIANEANARGELARLERGLAEQKGDRLKFTLAELTGEDVNLFGSAGNEQRRARYAAELRQRGLEMRNVGNFAGARNAFEEADKILSALTILRDSEKPFLEEQRGIEDARRKAEAAKKAAAIAGKPPQAGAGAAPAVPQVNPPLLNPPVPGAAPNGPQVDRAAIASEELVRIFKNEGAFVQVRFGK